MQIARTPRTYTWYLGENKDDNGYLLPAVRTTRIITPMVHYGRIY